MLLLLIRGRLKCCHDSLLQAAAAAALLALRVKLWSSPLKLAPSSACRVNCRESSRYSFPSKMFGVCVLTFDRSSSVRGAWIYHLTVFQIMLSVILNKIQTLHSSHSATTAWHQNEPCMLIDLLALLNNWESKESIILIKCWWNKRHIPLFCTQHSLEQPLQSFVFTLL